MAAESPAPSNWDELHRQLEAERHLICQEIREYPRPIAGCDQQFNYLLEQRAKITDELQRLTRAMEESRQSAQPEKVHEEFANHRNSLGDAAIP